MKKKMSTRDLKNLPAQFLITTKPNFFGTLFKGNKKGKFQYRFCIVFNGSFIYYETKNSTKPKGYFYLDGYKVSTRIEKNRIFLKLSHEKFRDYIFEVDSEEILQQWVDYLTKVILGFHTYQTRTENFNQYVDHPKRTFSISSSASSNSSSSRGSAGPIQEELLRQDDSGYVDPYSEIADISIQPTGDPIYDQPRVGDDDYKEPIYDQLRDGAEGVYDEPRGQYESMVGNTDEVDTGGGYESMQPTSANNIDFDQGIYVPMGSENSCETMRDSKPLELYFEEEDDDEDGDVENFYENENNYIDLTDSNLINVDDEESRYERPVITRPPVEIIKKAPVNAPRIPPIPKRRNIKKKDNDDVSISLQTLSQAIQESVNDSDTIFEDPRTLLAHRTPESNDVDSDYQSPDMVLNVVMQQNTTTGFGDSNAISSELSINLILPPSVYHPAFDKNLCVRYFEDYPPGVYLIRTERGDGMDALSVKTAIDVKHYLIFNKNNTFYLEKNEPAFATVAELIRHYYTHTLPTCGQMLTRPYS